jgi:hypothetical protein
MLQARRSQRRKEADCRGARSNLPCWRTGSVHLAQPFQGCEDPSPTQGSLASSATLGFEAESRWDSQFEKVHGHNAGSSTVEALREPPGEHAAPTELGEGPGALAAIDMALLRSFAKRFMVPMQVPRTLKHSVNRRANMPLLRSLGKDPGALAAIDMALLRGFAKRFMVTMQVPRTLKLSMNRRANMPLLRSLGKDQGRWQL